jgi:MFS family permease
MGFLTLNQTSSWMVASKLQKRSLLIAVNGLAGMSIFFFGYDPAVTPGNEAQANLTFSYDQGLMGGVNQSTDYIYRMGLGHIGPDGSPIITETLLQGGIMAIFYLGTLVGCLAGGSFGDKYGRIGTVGLGAAWAIFGAALQSSAMNPSWMLGSRFVNGIGTGILNGIVPAWASELADHTSRGTFIAMEFTLNIFGVVVAYWLAYGVSFIDNGESEIRWRFPIAFQILPLLFLLVVCWAFPESPRWLVKAETRRLFLFWNASEVRKVRMLELLKLSTTTFATSLNWKGAPSTHHISTCCLVSSPESFTLAEECSW